MNNRSCKKTTIVEYNLHLYLPQTFMMSFLSWLGGFRPITTGTSAKATASRYSIITIRAVEMVNLITPHTNHNVLLLFVYASGNSLVVHCFRTSICFTKLGNP